MIQGALKLNTFFKERNSKLSYITPVFSDGEKVLTTRSVTSARVLSGISHDKIAPGLRPAAKSSTDSRSLHACWQAAGAQAESQTLYYPGKAKRHCYNHIFSTELSTLVAPLIPCMPYQ